MGKSLIYLVATESSGDFLGGQLLNALSHLPLEFRGVGGPSMVREGLQSDFSVEDFNVMGLWEVLKHLPRLKRQFNAIVHHILSAKPKAIVLIDAPDFNIRLAKALRQEGIPLIYYVSPQVWAWRKKRAAQLAQWIHHMMVLFEFEVPIYEALGCKVTCVGHPLVDHYRDFQGKTTPAAPLPTILFGPGSRSGVIARHLTVFEELQALWQGPVQWVIPLAPGYSEDHPLFHPFQGHDNIRWIRGNLKQALQTVDLAILSSGTATLEAGLAGVPTIVGYRMHPISHWLAKKMVQVPHISLTNVVLEQRVFPELVQKDFCGANLVSLATPLLESSKPRQAMLKSLEPLAAQLGGGNVSSRAAQVVEQYL